MLSVESLGYEQQLYIDALSCKGITIPASVCGWLWRGFAEPPYRRAQTTCNACSYRDRRGLHRLHVFKTAHVILYPYAVRLISWSGEVENHRQEERATRERLASGAAVCRRIGYCASQLELHLNFLRQFFITSRFIVEHNSSHGHGNHGGTDTFGWTGG